MTGSSAERAQIGGKTERHRTRRNAPYRSSRSRANPRSNVICSEVPVCIRLIRSVWSSVKPRTGGGAGKGRSALTPSGYTTDVREV